MAKIDNYIAGREDGLQLALNIVKKKGVKGLEDEIIYTVFEIVTAVLLVTAALMM